MSWQDRPYSGGQNTSGGFGGAGGVRIGFPKPGKVVKWLLMANFAVFVVQAFSRDFAPPYGWMTETFGARADQWPQVWRLITFQFLHGGVMHMGLNMLGLYMLGTPVEGRLGPKRFLTFYLLCGAMAAVAYILVSLSVGGATWKPLVGASGGVFGLIVAAAVYFPHMRLVLMFFPMPIRSAAVVIFGLMVLTILMGVGGVKGGAFWSHVAHFGGAATAGVWLLLEHHRGGRASDAGPGIAEGVVAKIRSGQWERKMQEQQKTRAEVDRILEKIHTRGIASLSGKEKRLLKKATEKQRDEDKRINRM